MALIFQEEWEKWSEDECFAFLIILGHFFQTKTAVYNLRTLGKWAAWVTEVNMERHFSFFAYFRVKLKLDFGRQEMRVVKGTKE